MPRPAAPSKPNQRTPRPAPPGKRARPVAKPAGEPSPVTRLSSRAAEATPTDTALTVRELNRAFLARQLLLDRAHLTPLAAIEHLVALQAQVARPPFIGLWTRLHAFTRAQLHRLLHDRHVVRATFLRCTLHLTTAADFLALRPALQPMLTASFRTLKNRADHLEAEGDPLLAFVEPDATTRVVRIPR